MKAIIVEDEYIIADHLQTILLKAGVEVLEIADNLNDAEKTLALCPDFYLLDIRLGKNESGITFGKRLKAFKIPFMYITANNELTVLSEAVATQPETYISKPFHERDVIAAVELLKLRIRQQPYITVISNKGGRKIPEQNILYCEADGSYSRIYTADEVIVQRITLKELEAILSDNFLRVHRSFLINKNHIASQKSNSLFIGNREIPKSRTYR